MHPVILQIGPIVIGAYALMLTLAFLIGSIVAVKRTKKYGIPHYEVINLVIVILISSIVGSRLLFIWQHREIFSNDPIRILYIWQGGLSYYGGLLFAIVGFIWWLKRKDISVGRMLDIFAPSVALGFFFVRMGCFLNGCCFGKPTDMPWGVMFPINSPAGWIYKDAAVHPTQLYESLSGLMSFFFLLVIEKKFRLNVREGLLFFLFLIVSALWRFIIEFYRYQSPDSVYVGLFTQAQTYSIAILIFSIMMIALIHKKRVNP